MESVLTAFKKRFPTAQLVPNDKRIIIQVTDNGKTLGVELNKDRAGEEGYADSAINALSSMVEHAKAGN